MLKALSEPTRYKIFLTLLERRCCVRSLSRKLGITEAAVSQHLKKLKEAKLVYGERFGYHMHFYLRQEALDFLAEYFARLALESREQERDAALCCCAYRRDENEPAS